MRKADALSRGTDHKEGIKHDNEDVILLKPEYRAVHYIKAIYLLKDMKNWYKWKSENQKILMSQS